MPSDGRKEEIANPTILRQMCFHKNDFRLKIAMFGDDIWKPNYHKQIKCGHIVCCCVFGQPLMIAIVVGSCISVGRRTSSTYSIQEIRPKWEMNRQARRIENVPDSLIFCCLEKC